MMYFTDKLEMWTLGREKITYLGKRNVFTHFNRMTSSGSVVIKFNHIVNFPTGHFSLRFRADESQVKSQCGEYFKHSSGIISHTNYGNFEGTARCCLWIIEAGVQGQVNLNFLELGLNDYPFDYVKLWTIEGGRFELIDVYPEGNRPQSPPKLKRSVLIYFHADDIGAAPRLTIQFKKGKIWAHGSSVKLHEKFAE
ncbi:unnamed protein product [Echinostoma caproni]|uniref:CUB domain-containing protein n=1 Tax=Echinostoma caproni TaxID=27848 RepID=A0A183A6T7_9TREM|nr:unnamed protein product [Echinostoma caproni]